ncbi:MAG: hypothetical protein K1X94_00605 [Sandaracinaceae bacterium]|nr:hypothetical protein [Sandaracinaceae bacterium]
MASARREGRAWESDLAIHELVDASKGAWADLRHRVVLHHVDLGAELVARAFPDRHDAAAIVRAHVHQDLGEARTLAQWLTSIDVSRLPRRRARDLDAILEDERRRARLSDHEAPREVLAFLLSPRAHAPEHPDAAHALLANEAGIALTRHVLGGPRRVRGAHGDEVIFDPAYCAEAIVHRLHRRIPSLRELGEAIDPREGTRLARPRVHVEVEP